MEKEKSRSINRRSLLKGYAIGAAAGALEIFGARNAAAKSRGNSGPPVDNSRTILNADRKKV